jgi:hypothetical protein
MEVKDKKDKPWSDNSYVVGSTTAKLKNGSKLILSLLISHCRHCFPDQTGSA